MLNQIQPQNQSNYQPYQSDQKNNVYSKSQRKDSYSNNQSNQKYSSNKPYQPNQDLRNSYKRERSRSRDRSLRNSYRDYPKGNQNNYNNMNNRNGKSYYYHPNDRQFNFNNNRKDNYSGGYNNEYTYHKDDCLIIFQKNYFEFTPKDFTALKNELKRELKDDIYNIYYNNCISDISDKIFRFTTNPLVKYNCKSKALKIICDFLFDIMKQQNDKVTYLKLIFVIPFNVVGYIIGSNGKNINQIRDETNTKVEVYSQNTSKNFKKIEVAGVPQGIANAGEKICEISKKYFNFDDDKNDKRNDYDYKYDYSPQREKSWERNRNLDQGYGNNYYKERDRNDRYYDNNWNNRDYDRNNYNRDNRGMYNKERNDFRDMGYKNDYRNREGFRNYGGRDIRNNSRDFYDRNNNYNKDNNPNYRDNRDNGPRYKNGGRYHYAKGDMKNNIDEKDNNESKNRDKLSNRSLSKKSKSQNSIDENKSINNDNDGRELLEEKDYKDENDIKDDKQNIEQNLEPGEQKDMKNDNIDNNNLLNDNNKNNDLNEEDNENKILNENNEKNNIDNNDLNVDINDNKVDKQDEKENGEIADINNELERNLEENDKLCKIIIYLSADEINLLNNSNNENDNIWINLENSSHCNISKVNKNNDGEEFSLITFNGTLKQNILAIYRLQQYLLNSNTKKVD